MFLFLLYNVLKYETNEINIESSVQKDAKKCIEKMFAITA